MAKGAPGGVSPTAAPFADFSVYKGSGGNNSVCPLVSTTTVLPSKSHSERPKGAKNLVPGWQFAAVKRDCFVAVLLAMTSAVVVLGAAPQKGEPMNDAIEATSKTKADIASEGGQNRKWTLGTS